MAGIIAIYGLVVAVMIVNQLSVELHIYKAFMMLGAGLSVGMAGLGAGFTIGITGDAGVRGCYTTTTIVSGHDDDADLF